MTASYDEIYERYYRAVSNRERVALLEELIRLADSNNEIDVAYEARKQLTEIANAAGNPEKAIVAFSWCLSQFDKDNRLDSWHNVLWTYKTILEIIPVFASVSREQIVSMQEDMARRLTNVGESDRTAHYYRSWNFMRLGDYETALEYQETYLAMKRSSTSDCTACERDRQVELLSRMQNDKKALQRAAPIISGRMACAEVPHFTYAHIARSQRRLGKDEDAAASLKTGYKLIRREEKYLGTIGDLIVVEVGLDDLTRALKKVKTHLPWAVDTAADELRFRFYSGVALLFEALAANRPKSLKILIPKEMSCWHDDDHYDPDELASWFATETQSLADKFNARNGNQTYSLLIAENRELAGLASSNS